MPRVDFYVTGDSGPDARSRLACRIVEKAYLAEQRVLVRCASSEALARLDELLWTFGDGSFVPHDSLDGANDATETPVALTTRSDAAVDRQMLVNLTAELPPDWQRFERIAEVLDGAEGTRAAGRARFRAYRDAGAAPETHTLMANR